MTVLRVGRHPSCDVVIEHRSVSRQHAEMAALDDGQFELVDQGSTYGTFVKKAGEWHSVSRMTVGPDDPIMLGKYKTTPYLLQKMAVTSIERGNGTGKATGNRRKTGGDNGANTGNGENGEKVVSRSAGLESSKVRKLAAIVAADLVGYSSMMASDETGTLNAIREARQQIIDPKVERYNGRIFKTVGDALMMEFASVVKAVRCAADIQATLPTMTFGSSGVRLTFRMGVNIGDVIIEGDDMFGDGVNIAARLEQAADPGGICVSAFVYEQIKNKLDFGYEDMGVRAMKNIPDPVHCYKITETVSGRYIPSKSAEG